jgi:hypothetical protein
VGQHYSNPSRENDPHALPNVEVFYAEIGDLNVSEHREEPSEAGWYYWYCFPGCYPDGEAIGPFETEAAAVEAMREDASE